MSTELTVDLDRLDDIVTRLEGLAGYIHEHLDGLDDGVASLPGIWKSAGAQAYTDAHRRWEPNAREFAEGVAAMSDAAQSAHGRYTRVIDVNGRMLRG
ncbi:WXG100 family type VII secretion target [Nocardia sp. NEAU-G5]|uniref:WXG100 family type VII secretion target n=1 Tax=Nocardia albiluteola TaxID=2842303 RepID=A0ABS6B6U6_9NOCA|nr:WXG100 family type VII secretion target [Nocardia albiluteola]MBU3065994.1 WXG100 family type VII secretion target [Nocardia albiluteola]